MMNKKGQLSLMNILVWFVLVIIAAVITPILSTFMEANVVNTTTDATQIFIGKAVVPMMWVGLIITLLMFANPIQPRQFQ